MFIYLLALMASLDFCAARLILQVDIAASGNVTNIAIIHGATDGITASSVVGGLEATADPVICGRY